MLLTDYLNPGFSGYLDRTLLGEDLPIYADIKESDHLVIYLNGSINRKIKQPPVFHRQSWTKDTPFSSIVISDKSVEINDSLELAWYLGKPNGSFLRSVVSAITKIRDSLKLRNNKIIFYGTSGGGYAGILLASILRGSSCIAGNAQTDLSKFNYKIFDKFIDNTGYKPTHQKINIMRYLSDKKYIPQITFLQNTQDLTHFNNHYLPFIKWYGENRGALISYGPCEFIEYDKEGGHSGVQSKSETIETLERISSRNTNLPTTIIAKDKPDEALPIDTFFDLIEVEGVFEKVGEKLLIFIKGDITDTDIKALVSTGWRLSNSVGYFKYLTSSERVNTFSVKIPKMEKEYESGIIRWASKYEVKVKILSCKIENNFSKEKNTAASIA
ncbi:hypothetical protein ACJJIX_06740 [Microbulbifer sp. VAAC004]|uniref:hypothetical protein n=1 Tax=unclassified Microbulbifer TaxID=2619833 RepID=UPI0040396FD8